MTRLLVRLLNPLQPAIETARTYDLSKLGHDATAGLTVAVVAIPASMAYAVIAGVPAQYGLYTVIVHSLIGAIFNSQRMLSVGPINTQSLMTASAVTYIMRSMQSLSVQETTALYLQLVLALAIIKGAVQIAFTVARLGTLVRYVSNSVIVGFTAGVGVLIVVGQLGNFLGFGAVSRAEHWPGVIGAFQQLIPHLQQTSGWALLLGLAALGIVIGSRAISRMIPGPLIAVVVTGSIVAVAGWGPSDFRMVAPLPHGLPSIWVPWEGLGYWETLLGPAMAMGLLGLMEVYSISSALAAKTGQRVNANRELLSQGIANFLGGFVQSIPGSGSFTRSALNYYAGARTSFSNFFNAICVAAIFLLCARYARYVPMSALAAVLFVIAYGLIDWRYVGRVTLVSRADGAVCLATFAATLLVPLAYAVFIGIFLNLALYLRRASRLHMAEMVQTPAGPFEEIPLRDHFGKQTIMFLQVEGDLFFGVAGELQDQMAVITASSVQVVIFRLKRTLGMDATVMHVFERFADNMHARGGHVILCGVKPELLRRLQAFGLIERIGRENIFETDSGIFTSAKRALGRARELLGRSIDVEGWVYEI